MLGNERRNVHIASKVSPENCVPSELRGACERSLERLGTDVIDLYQVHWPPREVPFEDVHGELCTLREEGKIRYIGVSNFGAQDLDAWMSCGACVSNQLGYNLLFRAIEYDIVPACERHAMGILVYMPLLQGVLSGRWSSAEGIPRNRRRTRHFSREREGTRHGEPGCEELTFEILAGIRAIAHELDTSMAALAVAWLLAKPGIVGAIVGSRNAAQLARNLDAVKLELSDDIVQRLDAVSEPLKERLGTNCDMWLGQAESRIR
jgi:aryl-alcohol dehydrogenase-like predicted oxidoreductase